MTGKGCACLPLDEIVVETTAELKDVLRDGEIHYDDETSRQVRRKYMYVLEKCVNASTTTNMSMLH